MNKQFYAISGDEIISLGLYKTHEKAREGFKRLAASRCFCNVIVSEQELQTLHNLIVMKLKKIKPAETIGMSALIYARVDIKGLKATDYDDALAEAEALEIVLSAECSEPNYNITIDWSDAMTTQIYDQDDNEIEA
jgi:hypothetical protein